MRFIKVLAIDEITNACECRNLLVLQCFTFSRVGKDCCSYVILKATLENWETRKAWKLAVAQKGD
jgi:hypothetical protein